MVINKAKLKEAGYRVEEKNGEIFIFPLDSDNKLFQAFRVIMVEAHKMNSRDAERLADKFANDASNTLIFNLFD